MNITKHAEDRMKERMGLSRKSVVNMVERVLEKGISHSDSKGSLNKFFTYLYFKNTDANNIKIYGKFIFIFSGDTLITVLDLPHQYYKKVENISIKKCD